MKKLSDQELGRLLGRWFGDRNFEDKQFEFETELEYLRVRDRNEAGETDQRVVGLALLNEAARRLAETVNNPAEFETLLDDVRAYLAYVMCMCLEFEIALGKRQHLSKQ